MNEMDYNAAEGIRRSDLWKMEDSPEKFRYYLEHPVEQTPAMAFGSACHKYILEKDNFIDEYAVAPKDINRRTNAGKEMWEKFLADNPDKEIINQEDYDTFMDMRAAIAKNPLAKKLILGKGQTETAFFWTDPDTKEKCKIKTDRLVTFHRKKYVIDYKTCQSAETNRFNQDVFKLGYYMQAGMYAEGVKQALHLRKLPGFLFVAQEKKPPYSVNVIEVSQDVMKIGIAKFHELLDKYHECKMVDIWAGYVDDVPNETQLPGWWSLQEDDV